MATISKIFPEAFTHARVVSDDLTTTWNGSAMQAHASVADYGTDGVIVPATASVGTGGDINNTVTIPASLPGSTATHYRLYFFRSTPTVGAQVAYAEFVWQDGSVVDEASLQSSIDAGGHVVPLGATLTEFNVPQVDLPLGQFESRTFSITFTDDAGDPVSFQNDTVTCVVSTIRGTTALAEVSCTVATTDYNVIQIPFTSTHTASAGTFKHSLWSETDDSRVAFGAVPISPGVAPTT